MYFKLIIYEKSFNRLSIFETHANELNYILHYQRYLKISKELDRVSPSIWSLTPGTFLGGSFPCYFCFIFYYFSDFQTFFSSFRLSEAPQTYLSIYALFSLNILSNFPSSTLSYSRMIILGLIAFSQELTTILAEIGMHIPAGYTLSNSLGFLRVW